MFEKLKGLSFVVSGNISSGKTTLCSWLESLGFKVCYEDPEENMFLKDFYKDKRKWSLATQIIFTTKRGELAAKSGNVVFDRCIEDDEVFVNTLVDSRDITAQQAIFLKEYRNSMAEKVPVPKFILFLDVEPKECKNRLTKRISNRSENVSSDYESVISLGYLEEIHFHYQNYKKHMSERMPVFTLDWNSPRTPEEQKQRIVEILTSIENYIESGKNEKGVISLD